MPPSVPFHVQIHFRNGDIFRAFYYRNGPEFDLKMELSDLPVSTVVDGGTWPSLESAAAAAEAMLPDLAMRPEVIRNRPMLHLYVRHRRDTQSYRNQWVGDFRLVSITTYGAVAECCENALAAGQRIRVHRRKFERIPATICCECSVKSVAPIEGTNGFAVEFQDWTSLSIEREKRLQKGYYFESPSSYDEASFG